MYIVCHIGAEITSGRAVLFVYLFPRTLDQAGNQHTSDGGGAGNDTHAYASQL